MALVPKVALTDAGAEPSDGELDALAISFREAVGMRRVMAQKSFSESLGAALGNPEPIPDVLIAPVARMPQPAPPSKRSGARPTLTVFAGPNGSGKTSLAERAFAHGWLDGCVVVSPDEIAESSYGGWNHTESVFRAASEAHRIRLACVREGWHLAFETVLSTKPKLDFMRDAQSEGFLVRLMFLGTDSPDINAKRVATRVMQGGHDVPISKIISRHAKAIANLAKALAFVDRAYVYDNSADGEQPKILFRSANGIIERTCAAGRPWGDMAMAAAGQAHGANVPEAAIADN